jgi:hypothetical protein
MNPPFENAQDMAHIIRAYGMLKPGGRMVAVMANRETAYFHDWRQIVDGVIVNVLDGAFLRAERSTGVTVRILRFETNGEAPAGDTNEEAVLQAAS